MGEVIGWVILAMVGLALAIAVFVAILLDWLDR